VVVLRPVCRGEAPRSRDRRQAIPGQEDADDDGFGNRCDADLDNDCVVGISDFGIFKQCINLPGQGARRRCMIADFNSDHQVTSLDFQLFEELFAIGVPGPSGFATCE
jgi:hypothetical protein